MDRWNAIEPVFTGAVKAQTLVRPSARASWKNASYSAWPSPRLRA
jgi:hypothetical protein